MRAAEGDEIDAAVGRGRELAARLPELHEPDLARADGGVTAERHGRRRSLRGDADEVKEGDGARRRGGGGQRLELVLTRRGFQSFDDRDLVVDQGAEEVAEDGVEVVAAKESRRDVAEPD